MFDSAALMVEAGLAGRGVALAPARMFEGKGARPFDVEVTLGGYWLTRLKSRRPTAAMAAFESWIRGAAEEG